MPDEPVTEPVTQPDSGPEHTGPLTTDYMQNTLDEAFNSLPGAQEFLKPKEPETPPEKTPADKPAEPPAVEKQAEPEPEEKAPEPEAGSEDVVSPDDPEEKRQSTWNRLKKEAKEAAVLREQLKEFEGTRAEREALREQIEVIKKEQEAYLQEREVMEAELYRSNVKASPAFQKDVTRPFNVIREVTEQLAKENEIDSNELFGAIIHGDKKKMYELTEGLHNFDQNQIFQAFQDMRHIVAARDHHYANSKALAEQHLQESYDRGQYEAEQANFARVKALELIVPRLNERVLSVLPESKRVNLDDLRGEVVGFDAWPEEIKMYGGYASVLLPEVIDGLEATQAELKAAKAEIAKLRGGSPKVSKGQPATPSTGQAEDKTDYGKMSTDSLAEQAVQRMRQSLGLP